MSGSAKATELYVRSSLISSSEPVPVSDMVSGWDGPFESGRYAYGDARFSVGVQWQEINDKQGGSDSDVSWFLERESRWHYSLDFSRGMSRYYRALESGGNLSQRETLLLDVRAFEAFGVRLGRAQSWHSVDASLLGGDGLLDIGSLRLSAAVAGYRVGHYQFGHLTGYAEPSGDDVAASAELDYHFDEDKILEYEDNFGKGTGVSLDLALKWTPPGADFSQWSFQLDARDLFNWWQFDRAGFTDACINYGDSVDSVCSSTATASGRSGVEVYTARILPTWRAEVVRQSVAGKAGQLQLEFLRHGEYQRVGSGYDWYSEDPGLAWSVGMSLYSSRQVGLRSSVGPLSLSLNVDDVRSAYARDLDVSVGVGFRW